MQHEQRQVQLRARPKTDQEAEEGQEEVIRGLAQPLQMSREHEPVNSRQSQEPIGTPTSEGLRHATSGGEAGTSERPSEINKVIGVVCSGAEAYRDDVKNTIARGMSQRPDAVWVCCDKRSDKVTHGVMLSLGIEPVVLPTLDCMKGEQNKWGRPFDERRTWRDGELLSLCDELIVFHKRTGSSPWRERKKWGTAQGGLYSHLFVVELGPAPKDRARKGRKPIGV